MFIAAVSTTTTSVAFLSPRRPLLSHLLSSPPQLLLLLKNPTSKPSFLHLQARPPMASSFVAEYAKSNRSACKTCSEKIAANALRLGVVTKDKQRGFDATKWHHFHCFSFKSNSVSSVSAIRGFDSLKSDDQEAMKKLVEELGKEKVVDDDVAAGQEQNVSKKQKRGDSDDVVEKQESSKKLQLSVSEEANVKITLATSDIKDIYQGATLLPNWKAFHSIIFLEKDDGLQDSSKIAAFDFDGCLANTDVKRTGADAWSLMCPAIPDKLQKLYNDGYKLVIFTNESNIDRWKNKRQKAVDSKVGRLNNFINLVKVPIQVYIACGFGPTDPYRKPKTGMWHVMEQHFNSGIPVDMDQSFYVGDAAGSSVIATMCEELPPDSIILIYVSSSLGAASSVSAESSGGSRRFSKSKVLLSAAHDQTLSPGDNKKGYLSNYYDNSLCLSPRGIGGSNNLYPGDLLPFTRRPLFLVIDSDNSHAFKVIHGSERGEPSALLLSPSRPSFKNPPSVDAIENGSQFTLFLTTPLLAFCQLVGLSAPDRDTDIYGEAENIIANAFAKWEVMLCSSTKIDLVWAQVLPDPFLRRIILRFIFCRAVLYLLHPLNTRDSYMPDCLPHLPGFLSPDAEAVESYIHRLADHLKVSDCFYNT